MSTSIAFDPASSSSAPVMQNGIPWVPMSAVPDEHAFLQQIDHILRSDELSGSEILRRLLRFLAEKTISGEADELKEYSVAIDGLGQPASYDPKHTSAVRTQAGRLRQKLMDYYRAEGAQDAIVVAIPKGHFRLTCRYRASAIPTPEDYDRSHTHDALPQPGEEQNQAPRSANWWHLSPVFWIAFASIALNIYSWVKHPWNAPAADAAAFDPSPAMKELWNPFFVSKRPMMLVLEDPLFVEFHSGGGVYYRDKSSNSWDVLLKSAGIKRLRDALNNPQIEPSRYYTAFGEAHAAFVIGRLFGNRDQNFFSLLRASQVTSAQMASNNILSVGIPTTMFEDQLHEMPIQTQFQFLREGIRNLKPGPGEPAMYSDQFSTSPSEEGVAYALVSHLPGPQRSTDVESFVGNRAAAYVAAVEAFDNPDFARIVVDRLKQASGGTMPRYFQVVLKVSFRNLVPTDTTCIQVRQLE